MKNALITGVTGQDGAYLSKFLLDKGYKVYGTYRRLSTPNFWRLQYLDVFEKINLIPVELIDAASLIEAVKISDPHEVYHLAAQSFVGASFEQPIGTADVTGLGVIRVLEAVRQIKPDTRVYQASSSELYGKVKETPQKEDTPFDCQSPYSAAKLYGYWITKIYREAYNMFACNGILFNHESPIRGLEFVTRKISNTCAKIALGIEKELVLGNLEAKRDWGYAPEYCVDLKTSILTNEGFKFFNEISEGDIVLNYNPERNRLEEDNVLKKILMENTGEMYVFGGRGFKLRCSPNHRIYYQRKSKTSKGGWSDWKVKEAKDFYEMIRKLSVRTKYDFRLPHTQDYKKKNKSIDDEWFKLIGYLISEGCLKDNNRTLEISLSQSKRANKRVYEDIKRCLTKLKLSYKERIQAGGCSEFKFNAKSSRRIIDYFDGFDIHELPKWIFKSGDIQMNMVLKAMMDGDGSWGVMTYVSQRRGLIHSFQTLATILGYRTIVRKRESGIFECVLISKRKKYAYITKCRRELSKEKVWCVTTKNGTIVTNRDGGIAVSGNCESMWMILQNGEPDDFVVATNETHSVAEFVEKAFDVVGLDWQEHVKSDDRYVRPLDVELLQGDYSKAKEKLGWEPKVKFSELVDIMVKEDLSRWERWHNGELFPWDAPNYPDEANILTRTPNV